MRAHADVVFRALGDGAVLVNLADNRIFELNETGAAIWTRLVHGESIDAIPAALVGAFDVELPDAKSAVNALVADLMRAGLLEPC